MLQNLCSDSPHGFASAASGGVIVKIVALFFILCFFMVNAWALNSDAKLPLTFSASQIVYNSKTNSTLLLGQVQMQQGSSHLTADKVTFYSEQGTIKKMVAVGQLAHYTTQPDNQAKPLDIAGKTIEYYPKEKKAVIIGDAQYTQGETHFSSAHMVYDLNKKSVVSIPTDAKTKSILIVQPQDLPRDTPNANSPSQTP